MRVGEQPLRIRLGRTEHRRQVGQAGADDDQRQALLPELAGRAQRRHVVGAQVLHLVDEDSHAFALVGGQSGDRR